MIHRYFDAVRMRVVDAYYKLLMQDFDFLH